MKRKDTEAVEEFIRMFCLTDDPKKDGEAVTDDLRALRQMEDDRLSGGDKEVLDRFRQQA